MAGLDKILYFTRERLLSSDLNEQERIAARAVLDDMLYEASTCEGNQTNTAVTASSFTMGVVVGGLRVDPASGGVLVNPGMLTQPYSGGGNAPAADESNQVIGLQRDVVDVAIAVPGVDTWYLVQARASTLVTNATREEWDPGTETFSAIVVGRKLENVVELNVKAGTATDIPLPDAGWIPLGGVKRLAAGTDPTPPDMVDLRPLVGQEFENIQQSLGVARTGNLKDITLRTSHYDVNGATAGNTIGFRFETHNDLGRMFAQTDSQLVDITSAAHKDPATLFAGDTWYYLYLCKWGGNGVQSGPRHAYASALHQGVLVISHVPSAVQGSDVMPAGVSLPSPFALATARIGVCVGALLRNSANDGWVAETISGGTMRLQLPATASVPVVSISSVTPFSIGSGRVPVNARGMRLRIRGSGVAERIVQVKIGSVVIAEVRHQFSNDTIPIDKEAYVPTIGTTPAALLVDYASGAASTVELYIQEMEI